MFTLCYPRCTEKCLHSVILAALRSVYALFSSIAALSMFQMRMRYHCCIIDVMFRGLIHEEIAEVAPVKVNFNNISAFTSQDLMNFVSILSRMLTHENH